jgi:hypothetical protein
MTRRWWPWGYLVASLVLTVMAVWAIHALLVRHTILISLQNPSWTSDGKEIVFEQEYFDKREIFLLMGARVDTTVSHNLMKVAADGGRPKVLVENGWDCGCSPKLPLVAYVTSEDPKDWSGRPDELWIMDLNTSKKWRLASALKGDWFLDPATRKPRQYDYYRDGYPYEPRPKMTWNWSPSGEQILYRDQDILCFVGDPWGKDRSDVFAKAFSPQELQMTSWQTYWSRDGLVYLVTYVRLQGGATKGIGYKVDPKTWQATETRELAWSDAWMRDGAEAVKMTNPSKNRYARGVYPALNPDRNKAVFSPPAPGGRTFGPKLVVFNRTTGEEAVIADFSKEERGH